MSLVNDCNNCLNNDVKAHNFVTKDDYCCQGRRKHVKLERHDTSRPLFLNKEGAYPKNKKILLSLLPNLGGTCPHCPRFLRLWLLWSIRTQSLVFWPSASQLCESLATKPISGPENMISSLCHTL